MRAVLNRNGLLSEADVFRVRGFASSFSPLLQQLLLSSAAGAVRILQSYFHPVFLFIILHCSCISYPYRTFPVEQTFFLCVRFWDFKFCQRKKWEKQKFDENTFEHVFISIIHRNLQVIGKIWRDPVRRGLGKHPLHVELKKKGTLEEWWRGNSGLAKLQASTCSCSATRLTQINEPEPT